MAFNGILYRQAGGTLELNRSVGSFCVVESAKLEDKWQDGGVATLVLQTTEVLTFYSGDYIIARGKRYLICKTISEYTTLDDGKHQYTIPLESPDALFKNALMYNTVEIEDGGVYSWSRPNNFIMELGSVETLVKACCYNVNEVMGRRVFKLGTIDASVSDEYRVINFSDNNCWAALKQTCEHFDTFYTIRANTDETPDSDYIVDIGVEPGTFPETLQVGMRQGIAELTMNYADEDVYTQFVVLGSSENLPRGYEHERLQLDEDLMGTPPVYAGSLIVDESKYARWGRKRMELIFDDIKPTRIPPGTITSIPEDNIFAFYDTSLSEVLAVEENWNPVGGTVHILDRNLLGYTFEIIAFHSGTYKITIKQISDSNGLLLPNADNETFRFSAGMKYNLAGIALPNSYVVDAKTRLKAAAVNAINGYWTQPRASFSLTPDPFFLREKETDISCGWLIPIKHDALEIDKSIRVTSVTYDLLKDTYFDIDSVEVADITGKDNFMNSVHKSTQRSLNMLRDQGIINSHTAKESNMVALLNRIALSLHLPDWETLLEMLGTDKGLFTMINEEGEDIHVVNADLLRAGTALVNSLFTNELFVSGVQSETESLVNNYILHLTSQVATVACDSEGTVTGELPGSTAIVYHGASADTGWSFSGELSGCTGSVNSSTGIITITGLTADDSTVTVSATKTDKPTLRAVFRISKVYAGIDGEDGATTYTWIKYADVADGTGLYDTPTSNTLYIGIAVNKTTPTESTTKTDYTWSKFKGDQGVAGADGVTTYTWIKYASDSSGTGITDDPTGMTYIGFAYNKTTPSESNNPADYSWSLIKGTDGIDGIDGEDGADSVMYYLTPSVDAVIRSMDGTATPSTVSCAQYKIQGGGPPVAANKTIKYQRSIDGTMQTYSTAVAVSTSIYIDFYLYDGVTELWRTRVPVLHDLDEWESTLNDFAKGLGYTDTAGGDSAYEKLVGAALAGETIMEGGYLNTDLIEARSIVAGKIATGTITANEIDVGALAADDAFIEDLTVRFLQTVYDAYDCRVNIRNTTDTEESGASYVKLEHSGGGTSGLEYDTRVGEPVTKVTKAGKNTVVYSDGLLSQLLASSSYGYDQWVGISALGMIVAQGVFPTSTTTRIAIGYNVSTGLVQLYFDDLPRGAFGTAPGRHMYRSPDGLSNDIIRYQSP